MNKEYSLVHDKISSVLVRLALPMVMANFSQIAFGLIDMMWIGRLGSGSVSAVGTASFYINLASALATLITVGTGVKYAQSVGADAWDAMQRYFSGSVVLSFLLGALYFAVVYSMAYPLIRFYGMRDLAVVSLSAEYLRASMWGILFLIGSLAFTSLLTSKGRTQAVFKANVSGLVLNTILDPVLIFALNLGVVGAAWASNVARLLTFGLLVYALRDEFRGFSWKVHFSEMFEITKLGVPVAAQRVLFTLISMYMARIVVLYGTQALAAQKIGLQIESLTYVTIGGLQGALVAFVGQNFGSREYGRIKKGFLISIKFAVGFSLITSLIFILFPGPLMHLFIDEMDVIAMGVGYMRAIGVSQVFMCLEYVSVGTFNGMSKTYIPPLVSIVFTALRIPLALWLVQYFGLVGVWYSISLSSILKGSVLYVWMRIILSKGEFSSESYV